MDNVYRSSIGIVTVVNGSYDGVKRLLGSLMYSSAMPQQIVVVENSPQAEIEPNISETLQMCYHYPVLVVRCGAGANVSRARNVGWKLIDSQYVLFIDDDNTIEIDTLKILDVFMDKSPAAAVAPLILVGDTEDIWCAGVSRKRLTGRTIFRRSSMLSRGLTSWDTDDLPNAACIRRCVLERTGGYDENNFPMHREEADLVCRIKEYGWEVKVVGDAIVRHHTTAVSSVKDELRHAFARGGINRIYFSARSRVLFSRRHLHPLVFVVVMLFGNLPWLVVNMLTVVRIRPGLRNCFLLWEAIVRGSWNGCTVKLQQWPELESSESCIC